MTGDQILGPLGALVGALIAVGFLARWIQQLVKEYIATLLESVIALRQHNKELAEGWRAQTEANKILADAQASRNRDDEMRHRLEDAKKETRT